MSTNSESPDAWRQFVADLERDRAEELASWGDVDEEALALYAAGACSEDERARVERAAAQFPRVRELLEDLAGLGLPVRRAGSDAAWVRVRPIPLDAGQKREGLLRRLDSLVAERRSPASPADIYGVAAQAVVEVVGLECGLGLRRRDDDWEVVARYGTGEASGPGFSRRVLERVREERRTIWVDAAEDLGGAAVFAAPVLATADDLRVIGAIHGTRQRPGEGAISADVASSAVIGAVRATGAAPKALATLMPSSQALLIQGLADAVGAGLALAGGETGVALPWDRVGEIFAAELTWRSTQLE